MFVSRQAAIFAARRAASSVAMDDFERATERVIGGLPKNNSLMRLGSVRQTLSLKPLGSVELGLHRVVFGRIPKTGGGVHRVLMVVRIY